MLKRRSLVLLLVVLMLAVPAIAAAASVVLDDNLDQAVRDKLGFTEADDVAKADMVKLKELEDVKDVKKLDGLQYATKLEVLGVGGTFKDLSPIRNLPLKSLDLTGATKLDYKPDSAAMKIIQEIQHQGAVVKHDGAIKRVSGPDRYQTAVRIFQNLVSDGSFEGSIILARGDDFADALAGAPLAAKLDAPILLTHPDRLHKETKKVLLDNADKLSNIYVLGGKAAVSQAVLNELRLALAETDEDPAVTVERIDGANRYETAVEIAIRVEGDEINGVFIASGETFADALSAAPYAADLGIPILLTKKNELPECVVDYFKRTDAEKDWVNVVGGPVAVDVDVISDLLDLDQKPEVKRIWGSDRYATSVKLANVFIGDTYNLECANYIATGEEFADALTGALLAVNDKAGILLVKKNSVPTVVEDYLWDNRAELKQLTILGGEAAVSLKNAVKLYPIPKKAE